MNGSATPGTDNPQDKAYLRYRSLTERHKEMMQSISKFRYGTLTYNSTKISHMKCSTSIVLIKYDKSHIAVSVGMNAQL